MKANETFIDAWMGVINNTLNNWKKAVNSVSDEQEETVTPLRSSPVHG